MQDTQDMKMRDKEFRPFGWRDKWGYMFGDLANNMSFMLQSFFLLVFYTEVLQVPAGIAGTLFFVSRIVDAFTDVGMGRLVDKTPATKAGKFKPWIKRIAGPVALASFLMYQSGMQHAPLGLRIVYMYITYILWGSFMYTAINIPYGSMASVISPDPDHRTQISVFRGSAGTLASMIIGTIVPLIIFTEDAGGNQVVKTDSTFTWMAGVFSLFAILFYFICYKWTTERVKIVDQRNDERTSFFQSMGNIFKSRALWGITIASLFLLLATLMIPQMNNYIYPNYFNSSDAISIVNFLQPLATLIIVMPLASALATRFGKKEIGASTLIVGGLLYILLFVIRTDSMWVFMSISILAYLFMSFFNAVVWGSITDVIDDHEIQTGQREDGQVYAINSFARKVGQSFAGGAAGWALTAIGYVEGAAQQTPEVLEGLYSVATIVPAAGMLLAAAALIFIYPLSRKRTIRNSEILAEKAAKIEAQNEQNF